MKTILGVLVPLGLVGAGVWAMRGRGGSLSGSRRRRRVGLRGPHEVRELKLYCENDGDLYRQQVQPIHRNLEKKIAKGVYDHAKAKKLWMYLADNCAKKYAKEFGSPGTPWHKMFSTADRREVAAEFADEFKNEYDIQHPTLHGYRS